MGINTVTISGNVGDDPEIRYFESGTNLASFSIAVTNYKKGEKHTVWVTCKAFNKVAELIGNYVTKGTNLAVSGKLDVESWVDKQTGAQRTKTVIIVNDVQLPSKKEAEEHATAAAF